MKRIKEYTLQLELDVKYLGNMWGCTFTNFINLFEHALRFKADKMELWQFIGGAFSEGLSDMANYKHHDYAGDSNNKPPDGWDEKANPEWHYYVHKRQELFDVGVMVFKKRVVHKKYKVALMRQQYGGIHYCLLTPFNELINPDPNLEGAIEEIRPFIY